MTIASNKVYEREYNAHAHRISELMHSDDVNLRMAAGETLALIQELMQSIDDEFILPNADDVLDHMRELATDSAKFRNKKDRKMQRQTFREILQYIEDDEPIDEKIVISSSPSEILYLDLWRQKVQYEMLCRVLRIGTNIHLRSNPIIRSIFDLGDPLDLSTPRVRTTSGARAIKQHQANVTAERKKARGKQRDKRTKVLVEEEL